jgi:hypothetical protein
VGQVGIVATVKLACMNMEKYVKLSKIKSFSYKISYYSKFQKIIFINTLSGIIVSDPDSLIPDLAF